MEALCGELSARHGCHLLSNYPVWYRIIEEKLELSRYADGSFVSCNLGVRKPHPGIYQAAIDQLGDPGAMIFVDDRQQNCDAAMALGIDALRFRDAATLRGELVARGLLD